MGGTMRGVLFCFLLSVPSIILSQTLLEEDFAYPAGDTLTAHTWLAHASGGTNPILVDTSGLDYAGYPGSGIGNSARLSGAGEAIHRDFSEQSNTTVYASFLVNVQNASATASGRYFFHLNSSATHAGRIHAQKTSDMIAFGLAVTTEEPVFTDPVFGMNTVYLVVLRYDHKSGAANDTARVYIFEGGIPPVEPGVPTLGPFGTSGVEPGTLSGVSLRQTNGSGNDVIMDGIRVATSWSEAGLPVELSWFGATATAGAVELKWRTESEVDNFGFEIERRPFTIQPSPWTTRGFVQGTGTSPSPREYAFVDKPGEPGRYAYRIRQIDLDGTATWSKEAFVEVETEGQEAVVSCYPNPFNGAVNFLVRVPEEGRVVLTVHDVLGREVAKLLDETRLSGTYRVFWSAEGVSSGVYYYQADFAGTRTVGRVVFLK